MLTFRCPDDIREAAANGRDEANAQGYAPGNHRHEPDDHHAPATHHAPGNHRGNGALAVIERRFREMLAAYEDLGCDYDPDDDGFFVLLEPGEATEPLVALELPDRRLVDLTLEAVHHHAHHADHEDHAPHGGPGLFECVYCPSNSWAMSIFVPDGPGLDPGVRAWLEEQAVLAPEPLPLSDPAARGGDDDG